MKIKSEELLKMKPLAIKTRLLAQQQFDQIRGTKPRAEEETTALSILTINRVNKAIKEGRWIFKGDRRIEFRGY